MLIKRVIAAVLCLCVATACLSGCNDKESSSAQTTTTTSSVDGIEPVVEQEYEYSFPSFLENKDAISLFSNLIYTSFDARASASAVTEQPFENYECEYSFLDGSYYSYKSDNKRGLLDSEGNVILSAGYSEIVMIRPDAFLLTTEAGEEKYAFIGENGIVTTEGDGKNNWFTLAEPLKISQTSDNEASTVSYYLEAANGKVVYDKYWDVLEPVSLDTTGVASYSAYLGDSYYYIVFDKYYNYKIYEGSYAVVEVFVDGKYGSCYVLNIDDFHEISSMIDSFGNISGSRPSPTSEDTDYVKFTFGNTASNKSSVTVSADGFVYTESIDSEDGIYKKYFAIVDKMCFSDIVNWINTELSKEYVHKQ